MSNLPEEFHKLLFDRLDAIDKRFDKIDTKLDPIVRIFDSLRYLGKGFGIIVASVSGVVAIAAGIKSFWKK